MDVRDFFAELLNRGISYRYPPEAWAYLSQKGGKEYPSPIKSVEIDGQIFTEELIQPALKPMILENWEKERLTKLALAWQELLKAQWGIFSTGLQDCRIGKNSLCARMVQKVAQPEELAKGHLEPGYPIISPFIRLDCLRTKEGFKIMDINSTRPAGVGDFTLFQQTYCDYFPEQTKQFEKFDFAGCFAKTVRQCWQSWQEQFERQEKPNICMLIEKTAPDLNNFMALAEVLRQQDWTANVQLVQELPADTGQCPLVIRSRIKAGHPLFPQLEQGYPSTRCVVSPLYRRWLGNKFWFYYLIAEPYCGELKSRMNISAYELITQHFITTGVVKDENVEFNGEVKRLEDLNHNQWVLKPPSSSSARGVIFGRGMSKRKWLEALALAGSGNALLQLYQPVKEIFTIADASGQPKEVELYSKYGVYLFNGELAGVEIMARPSYIVHGARDTYYVLCLSKLKNASI